MDPQILNIATLVRAEFERYQKSSRQAQLDWDKNLACACLCASRVLVSILNAQDIPATVVVGTYKNQWNTHAWIQVADEFLDITATQFNPKLPKVYVGTEDPSYHLEGPIMAEDELAHWYRVETPVVKHLQKKVSRILASA